ILSVCLKSIYEKTTYKNYEIIVVDNGSKEEETLNLFDEYSKYENFRVLRLDCEFNYSYLNNEAVKIANGEYILLLNNDTEVITTNWIEQMLGYARQNHVGAVGSKLYFPDNTIQHCGVILGLYLVAGHCFWNYSKDYDYDNLTKIASNFSAVTAACLMVSKDKFIEVGMLNEVELKVGSNDVDLCIRLMNAGYYNVLNPQVELYHHESKSRGIDNKTIEKYNRCKGEVEYMLKNYNDLIVNDPFYNKNYSLMKAYFLDKQDGSKIRQENIDIFCC
ncbi:MAG: glycosyltransferase family 2 protein, partial [Bacilli bacterium]